MLTPPVAARNARRTRSTASRSRSISDSFIVVLSNDGGAVNNFKCEDKEGSSNERGRRCEFTRGEVDALCSVLKCLDRGVSTMAQKQQD